MRKMPQTRFAQTVCHFSHNADFDQLRISKYPANALCIRADPAPTADDGIARLSFDIAPF